jgi:hypothetical protein
LMAFRGGLVNNIDRRTGEEYGHKIFEHTASSSILRGASFLKEGGVFNDSILCRYLERLGYLI